MVVTKVEKQFHDEEAVKHLSSHLYEERAATLSNDSRQQIKHQKEHTLGSYNIVHS